VVDQVMFLVRGFCSKQFVFMLSVVLYQCFKGVIMLTIIVDVEDGQRAPNFFDA
jgi:hypothetical protein